MTAPTSAIEAAAQCKTTCWCCCTNVEAKDTRRQFGEIGSRADRHGRLKAEAVSPRKPRGETVYPTCVSARGDTKRASERGVESSRELATESQRAKRCCDVGPVTGTAGAQSAVEDRVRKGDWDVPFRITRSKTHLEILMIMIQPVHDLSPDQHSPAEPTVGISSNFSATEAECINCLSHISEIAPEGRFHRIHHNV